MKSLDFIRTVLEQGGGRGVYWAGKLPKRLKVAWFHWQYNEVFEAKFGGHWELARPFFDRRCKTLRCLQGCKKTAVRFGGNAVLRGCGRAYVLF